MKFLLRRLLADRAGALGAQVYYRVVHLHLRGRRGHPVHEHRKTRAFKQSHGFIERQADDGGMRTRQHTDECLGAALDGIAAGLAAPFVAGDVAVDILARQAFETQLGLDTAGGEFSTRTGEADGGVNPVRAPREPAVQQPAPREPAAKRQAPLVLYP